MAAPGDMVGIAPPSAAPSVPPGSHHQKHSCFWTKKRKEKIKNSKIDEKLSVAKKILKVSDDAPETKGFDSKAAHISPDSDLVA